MDARNRGFFLTLVTAWHLKFKAYIWVWANTFLTKGLVCAAQYNFNLKSMNTMLRQMQFQHLIHSFTSTALNP